MDQNAERPGAADQQRNPPAEEFERQAGLPQMGVISEFRYFLAHNKKWWLTPIILVLLVVGLLVVLGGSGVAPFIYTLF